MSLKILLGDMRAQFESWLRLWDWWVYAIAAIVVIAVLQWQQMGVLVWKVALVAAAVVLGYSADRALFYRTQRITEELPKDIFGGARILARAIIVAAVIVGLTEGL